MQCIKNSLILGSLFLLHHLSDLRNPRLVWFFFLCLAYIFLLSRSEGFIPTSSAFSYNLAPLPFQGNFIWGENVGRTVVLWLDCEKRSLTELIPGMKELMISFDVVKSFGQTFMDATPFCFMYISVGINELLGLASFIFAFGTGFIRTFDDAHNVFKIRPTDIQQTV